MKLKETSSRIASPYDWSTCWEVIAAAVWFGANTVLAAAPSPGSTGEPAPRFPTLFAVFAASADMLHRMPIEHRNLACAEGLGGMSLTRAARTLRDLEAMAAAVRRETEHLLPRYRAQPGREAPTEAQFRMMALATVLQQDLGVRYNPIRAAANASGPEASESFFADAADIFLHGAAGPGRMGTCSSLPVLYVAVGRRLGYPLRLVRARAHLFVRWETPGERFNIEATCVGYVSKPDAYYRTWPLPMTPAMEKAERLLISLDAEGETSVFLHNRALCLRACKRDREAAEAVTAALRLDPSSAELRRLAQDLHSGDPAAP